LLPGGLSGIVALKGLGVDIFVVFVGEEMERKMGRRAGDASRRNPSHPIDVSSVFVTLTGAVPGGDRTAGHSIFCESGRWLPLSSGGFYQNLAFVFMITFRLGIFFVQFSRRTILSWWSRDVSGNK